MVHKMSLFRVETEVGISSFLRGFYGESPASETLWLCCLQRWTLPL